VLCNFSVPSLLCVVRCTGCPGCSLCAWALTVFTASTAIRSAGCSRRIYASGPSCAIRIQLALFYVEAKAVCTSHICPVFCLIEPWLSLALFIMASFHLNRAIANIDHSPDPERVFVWAPFSTLQRSHQVSKLPRYLVQERGLQAMWKSLDYQWFVAREKKQPKKKPDPN
jgi:hypothetical protein